MDQWGPDGCAEREEEIVAWLVEAADDLKVACLPLGMLAPGCVKRQAARWLVREAIRRARAE